MPRLCAAAGAAVLIFVSCGRNSGLPEAGSPKYLDLVRAFYVGLGALRTGADEIAKTKLTLATQIAPNEPATWADLAVLALRQQDFDTAFKNADQARSLMPSNSRIEELLGVVESKRGKSAEAIAHLKKAFAADPHNLKALYALAEETERQASGDSDAEAEKLFAQVASARPNSVAALLEVARLAAKTGDSGTLKTSVSKLAEKSAAWPDAAKQQMRALQEAAGAPNARPAAVRVIFLRNTLVRDPQYRHDLSELKTPSDTVADPFPQFLKLPSPSSQPATADSSLHFEPAAVPEGARNASWIGALPFDDSGKVIIVWAADGSVQIDGGAKLPFPGGKNAQVHANSILGLDLNYDFKLDLVLAGSGGIRFFEQQDLKTFTDVTSRSKLPPQVINGSYTGAWAFDVDLDGDLDIVLGSPQGDPVVLRNNGDGTFAVIRPFPAVNGLKAFASADIDGDGDPDVAIVDSEGRLHVFSNERLGQFRERPLPPGLTGQLEAVIPADVNDDDRIDFVLLGADGSVIRLSDKDAGAGWDFASIAKVVPVPSPALIAADFDNNGRVDLLVGAGEILMGGANNFVSLSSKVDVSAPSVADLNGDGRLDLIGVSRQGAQPAPAVLANRGDKNYHWQNVRVRASATKGDQRINSFGIGGEIEVRAGLVTQKQVIASPLVHFGIGEQTQADVARIIWPNGAAQAEFELPADHEIQSVQRLKGSCPWLFAWDGKQMTFVKDAAPWSPALGLHINAQKVAGITQTQEWFKIPGESLQPRDGYYDLRITAELWESFYIDHYSLLVVDHPEGTDIYTDERFAVPPPPLKIVTTAEPQPFASARDDQGADVSAIVHDQDKNYLDTFGRGPYQGLTRDHWVELALPAEAPSQGQLYLIGSGWMHPTDATVNIAIGQSSIPQPEGLSIEVPDARGRWITVKKGLGFPAGKQKTVVLDLTGIFEVGAPRKLRLRTNLEIYWDRLAWAIGVPDRNQVRHLPLASAELRYRGFSTVKAANPSSPELPDYNTLMGSGQVWRDLEGYATRYGDVRELLEKIDDRFVIENAGDELCLRFLAPPPPPAGWKRDYVMIGDGWVKDGDFNTVFSKTVLPLPHHGMKDYATQSRQLEDDPAYKLHPSDWQNYHTRYISTDAFRNALRN